MAAKPKRSHAVRGHGEAAKSRGLAWFIAGALAGGVATWVVLGRDPTAEQMRAAVERTVGRPIGVDPTIPPPKPKFEFYTLLPEQEVVVSDEELPTPPGPVPAESAGTAGTQAPASPVAEDETGADKGPALESGHYILQVASFRSVTDADGLKAKLTLLGFRPVVQTVAIDSDDEWHRVRIGPYADRDSLEAARIRLRTDGYDDPLVVWVKKG